MGARPANREIGMAETFEELRPLLFSIAYRMLGSVAEAEDIVQDAFVRYQRALVESGAEIESPKAYLSAVTTRLAIDQLRSARARKETYIGEWLPEPLLTDEHAPDAARHAEDADSLSMAFLLLLERLSPVERAVFLLHDVFDYHYDEVAAIVGKSEANSSPARGPGAAPRRRAQAALRGVSRAARPARGAILRRGRGRRPRRPGRAPRRRRRRVRRRWRDEPLVAQADLRPRPCRPADARPRPPLARARRGDPARRDQPPARCDVPRRVGPADVGDDRRRRRRRRADRSLDHQPGQAPPPRPARRRPRAHARAAAAAYLTRLRLLRAPRFGGGTRRSTLDGRPAGRRARSRIDASCPRARRPGRSR